MTLPAGREASPGAGVTVYQRQRPEQTLLYQLVEAYYPAFDTHCTAQGKALPSYVRQEFEDYLKCGRLEHGFLRVRCDTCHAEHLVAFSCKRRGFCPSCGARRMVESAALAFILLILLWALHHVPSTKSSKPTASITPPSGEKPKLHRLMLANILA